MSLVPVKLIVDFLDIFNIEGAKLYNKDGTVILEVNDFKWQLGYRSPQEELYDIVINYYAFTARDRYAYLLNEVKK